MFRFSEEAIARAHNSGEAKRWRTGKPLADLWISNARHPWWEIIHPRHLPKSVPVDRAHWDIRKRAGQPSSRFYGRSSQLRKTMVHHLVLLERAFSDQDKIVKRLQTSKMQKILKFVRSELLWRLQILRRIKVSTLLFHASFFVALLNCTRYIIGGPWNWAMVAANWLVKALQGMISGAGLYYRSQLLIVAQQFALKVRPCKHCLYFERFAPAVPRNAAPIIITSWVFPINSPICCRLHQESRMWI